MRIPDKLTMRDLYIRGAFGNRFPCVYWKDYQGVGNCLMYNSVPGIQLPNYTKPLRPDELKTTVEEWVRLGCKRELIVVSGSAAFDNDNLIGWTTIQGEVMQTEAHLGFLYALGPTRLHMRDHLRVAQQWSPGLSAWLLIKKNLDTNSWDNLQYLFDEYPGAVIEFTCYDRGVGILGWNTVFWEVRHY